MLTIPLSTPSDTFNAALADIEDIIGRTPDLPKRMPDYVDKLLVEVLGRVDELPKPAKAFATAVGVIPSAPMHYGSKLDAALAAARRGFDVFPCRADTKRPHILGWPSLASRDEAQIRKWWTMWPNANIGAATTALLVVDVDVKTGGPKSYAQLKDKNDFPETLMNKTGSGGDHIIYTLPRLSDDLYVPGSESKVAPGIDIKSWHGFILLPGSTFNGKSYSWGSSSTIAAAPGWLVERCTKPRIKPIASAGKRIVPEDDWARDAAWEAVKNSPTVQQGTRNTTCVALANAMFDFGVELETAIDYAEEWSSNLCLPPMDTDEVKAAVTSAMRYRKYAIGYLHPDASGFEAADIGESEAEWASRQKAKGDGADATSAPFVEIAPPLEPFSAADLPEIPWVIKNLSARRTNVVLVGPGGASKSTYTTQLALGLITGRSDICGYQIRKRGRVWMLNQEDDFNYMKLRLLAAMQAFDVSWDDVKDENGEIMLRMCSGLGNRHSLVERDGTASGFKAGTGLGRLIASVKNFRADLVILDPLVSLHQGNEIANHEMRAVMDILGTIGVHADAGMICAHHTPKPDKTSSRGFAGDVNAARGASAIVDAARGTVTLMSMSEDDAKTHWTLPAGETRSKFVRLDDARMSFCATREEPWWFKREPVHVGGDKRKSSYVLRPVKLEPRVKTGKADILHNIAKVIAERLTFDTPHLVAALVPHLSTSDAELLTGHNRGRLITTAFGGADVREYPTDFGILVRAKLRGNGGTTFTLRASASAPQTVSEAQTSD